MRFFLVFLLAAMQLCGVNAILRLQKCGTAFDKNWVSNCSPTDQDGCYKLCSNKCRTASGRWMANGADCDCYC
ncbi:hypothetical protein CPAR01_15448 [Colletotrichum paranaense]|uniref:Uncharacterized protein n=5 Tax=Colletotrichum acutatum species complex TaxID=2707335 RepID=A0A9Q8SXI2_9PEZI|nr:uncharacterized protein CLUP02_10836 [Colletotrichum lupini]XP_060315586.1 uncharacterized protein CCOS01_05637 [Colletotrichum costaricense]XP_060341697.1 uncharacterized protein CPAR01_15448 [Colletotrichum paranaense]KAK0373392.1 hypothetical protein CLIM01_09263 [Colletotrichum limetticola]KAK1468808.1 hypothetical protein CMEL01_00575 [Colletotrichum melonis]KAK1519955.1 hypothetical protein CPAR01_15448 [Colletotrichum paranaense]KAK1530534.1 hypothetical protein CCOS01_05637 [Collet